MEPFKLKIRIGAFEFEAEGEQDTVERQFATFRELMMSPAALTTMTSVTGGVVSNKLSDRAASVDETAERPESSTSSTGSDEGIGPIGVSESKDADLFRPIYRTDKDPISLTAVPTGKDAVSRAALLLLYGHRLFKETDAVGGTALMDGLNVTGFTVERADRALAPYMSPTDPMVIRFGKKRGVKYRLNNRGVRYARQLAEEMRKSVT